MGITEKSRRIFNLLMRIPFLDVNQKIRCYRVIRKILKWHENLNN